MNTTAAREHVGDIERSIRTVRERARCINSELPYGHCMPDPMVIQLIYNVVFWLNVPIWENGASGEFSPREIVTGLKVNFKSIAGLYGARTLKRGLTRTRQTVWMAVQHLASTWGLPAMSKGLSNAPTWRPKWS